MGVPSTVKVQITNPTARVVKLVRAGWGFSSDLFFPAGCDRGWIGDPRPPFETVYPLSWYTL